MKFFIETFGCQMNVADSEEMSRHLSKRGFRTAESKEEADIVLLNTCTVRQHAEDKALSFIGRMKNWKKQNSKRIFIVAGCAAERLKNSLKKRFPQINLVAGAKEIEKFPEQFDSLLDSRSINCAPDGLAQGGRDRRRENDNFDWFEESETSFDNGNLRDEGNSLMLGENGKTAFVTVMRGCNYSCSYCIVPYVRGREIYRPVENILDELREKANQGAKEVMLLGQTVNSYWYRQKTKNGKWRMVDFSDLLLRASRIEGIEEIRFMSPHPHYMNDRLIQTLSKCKKISPKIHLPVQSGSNKVLGAMKRNYSRENYIDIAAKLNKAVKSLQLSTDIIVGFPTETEEDFKETLSLVDAVQFSSAYCFKYSARAGTESARLQDAVPLSVKEDRLKRVLKKIGNRK